MRYLLLTSLLFFFSVVFGHEEDILLIRNVEVTETENSYLITGNLINVKSINVEDVRIEIWINGEPTKWKRFDLIKQDQKKVSFTFKLYKEKFNYNTDIFEIEIVEIFNKKHDWGGYTSPPPDSTGSRQKNELGYEVIADIPWRMNLRDKTGNIQGIPVHIFVHDANGILGSVKLDYVNIRLKNAGNTSFNNPLTYNSWTDADFEALFSCQSIQDSELEIQEFEMDAFSKSSTRTIEFDKESGWLSSVDFFKFNEKFGYFTFNIPPADLVGFTNELDVEVEMSLDDKPDRIYRFRIFRSEESIPKQENWYRGDTHLHSIYTQNDAETGLPLCATKAAAKLIGIDWITTTDHTSDIDNYGTSINSNWSKIMQDIENHNNGDNSMLYIPGQEVAVSNAHGKLVHMLAYPSYNNPQNFPFLGDGKGDVSGTDVYVNDVITALSSFDGFSYAAHPFSTGDKLPSVPIGGGIWNLDESTFPDNSATFPETGGNIICNDLNEPTDVFSSDPTKYIKDALKGGQIWNVRNSLETGGDDRDPWDVNNTSANEFAPVSTSSLSHHIQKFRQGQEIINHINKRALYWKNQNASLQNWKFYMSAGSDAHGSFNFTNTDDFGGFGTIHDNAVGKLATITYCPNGMGANGENVLEALYKGHTTLSDGPILTIGVSNDGEPIDNEILMGDDDSINILLIEDYDFNLRYTTSSEFGLVEEIVLYLGTENGEMSYVVTIDSTLGDHTLSFKLNDILTTIYGASIPLDKYIYLRAELKTKKLGMTNIIHRRTEDEFWSFSNPIWMQYKEIPIPKEFNISAYPNPYTNELNVKVEKPMKGDVIFNFYDDQGKLLKSFTEYVTESEIVVFKESQLGFSKGNYLIQAKSGDEKISIKVMKH